MSVPPQQLPKVAIRLIRGVGDAEENSSLQDFLKQLSGEAAVVTGAAEINWSWRQFVSWPYPRKAAGGALEPDLVDLEFLRVLGQSLRAAAMRGIGNATTVAPYAAGQERTPFRVLFSAPALVLTMVTGALFGLPALTWAAGAALLIAAVAVLFEGIIIADRAHLFGAFRSAALLLLWPLIFIAVLPATKAWRITLTIGLPVTVMTMTDSRLPVLWLVHQSAPQGIPIYDGGLRQIAMFATALLILVLITILLGFVYARVRRVLAPVLKILADVLLYTGNDGYRLALWSVVRKSLEEIDPHTPEVYIVAHSLGSVIAVDVLRQAWTPPPGMRVTLITGGSPLMRLFHRFFGQDYPPAVSLLATVRARIPQFRWINVYRPNDPIGAALGLPDGADICTDQHHLSWLRAHPGYWGDPIAHSSASAALDSYTPPTAENGAMAHRAVANQAAITVPGGFWIRWLVIGILSFVLCRWAWDTFIAPVANVAAGAPALQSQGVITAGRLYRNDDTRYPFNSSFPIVDMPRIAVEFLPAGASSPVFWSVQYERCNRRAIQNLFKGNQNRRGVMPTTGTEAVFIPVDVRYLPGKTDTFEITQCGGGKPSAMQWIGGIAPWLTGCVALIVIAYTLVRFFLTTTLAAFVGLTDLEYRRARQLLELDSAFTDFFQWALMAFVAGEILWMMSW